MALYECRIIIIIIIIIIKSHKAQQPSANASLAPDGNVRGRGQVVTALLEDCSAVAVRQQQKSDLQDV